MISKLKRELFFLKAFNITAAHNNGRLPAASHLEFLLSKSTHPWLSAFVSSSCGVGRDVRWSYDERDAPSDAHGDNCGDPSNENAPNQCGGDGGGCRGDELRDSERANANGFYGNWFGIDSIT